MAQGSMDSDRLSSAGISTHSSGTAGNLGGSVVGVRVGDNGHKQDEDEYNLGPLPPMWEKAFTPSGEVYFIDHNTGTSHWLDPRLARVRKHSLGECNEHELPYGWERVSDERYGCYYVDHINRRTQYENPVLQARRLRAEKMGCESNGQSIGAPATGELRGEKFTVTLTKGTQGLGFTLIGAEGIPETEGYLQIRSIVPHSPAWIDGALRPGDVVVGVGSRGVRGLSHAAVAQIFQSIPSGSDVTLHLVRGYPLTFDCADPNTRVLSTLAVDASTPPTEDASASASAMQQLTRALRTRFNLDSPNTEPSPSHEEPQPDVTLEQRRLLSRSFDLDELSPAPEPNPVPPRCPSADHLLSIASGTPPTVGGQELSVSLQRGTAGFGFTIADSVHGQKVKKVLDRSRCAGLREGDLLLSIGEHDVRHAPHLRVVQVLKECPAKQATVVRVWRRDPSIVRAPRSRSATRLPVTSHNTPMSSGLGAGRSKTPTADQLRSSRTLHPSAPGSGDSGAPAIAQESLLTTMRDIDTDNTVEATYAVPEHKSRERESLIDRRRRSSTPGGRLTLPVTAWTEPTDSNPQAQWLGKGESYHEGNANQWKTENTPQNNSQWQSSENQPPSDRNGTQWQEETWLDNSNSNVRNWAESTQKWDNNNQYTENGQKWNDNGQKWNDNSQKWNDNSQKWNDNGQKWNDNGQKWSDNGQKWNDNSHGQKWESNSQKWEGGNNENGWEANGERWGNGNWGEVSTPTVHVDMNAAYWRGNASVADSSDNGGFPEDGMPQSPTTAAVSGLARHSPANARHAHSPNSIGVRHQSPMPGNGSDRLLGPSPSTLRGHSPSARLNGDPQNNRLREGSPSHRIHSPYSEQQAYPGVYPQDPVVYPGTYPPDAAVYPGNYPLDTTGYAEAAYGSHGLMVRDPQADVVVRLSRGAAGFGFRIVGGIEDGSRVAVGYVVPGGPADGLLRPGDLLTSVDGVPLTGATHARAVHAVCQAAARGHATLGIRHNRADVTPTHQPSPELGHGPTYNILHPAPLYPPAPAPGNASASVSHLPNANNHGPMHGYGGQYEQSGGNWTTPYEVTITRAPGEGFGFVVISSTNKATSTIGQLIPGSPAARCGVLRVGDTLVAINGVPVRNLSHPEVVTLIKRSGNAVTLTVLPSDGTID